MTVPPPPALVAGVVRGTFGTLNVAKATLATPTDRPRPGGAVGRAGA